MTLFWTVSKTILDLHGEVSIIYIFCLRLHHVCSKLLARYFLFFSELSCYNYLGQSFSEPRSLPNNPINLLRGSRILERTNSTWQVDTHMVLPQTKCILVTSVLQLLFHSYLGLLNLIRRHKLGSSRQIYCITISLYHSSL